MYIYLETWVCNNCIKHPLSKRNVTIHQLQIVFHFALYSHTYFPREVIDKFYGINITKMLSINIQFFILFPSSPILDALI